MRLSCSCKMWSYRLICGHANLAIRSKLLL
ncbi:MAG: SWIM zinc finger family protein [Candidatus Obscuribacterales bacterium]|nr:SWIM zinc finger family protein [Candidatus Obscuribacterales bacterium]